MLHWSFLSISHRFQVIRNFHTSKNRLEVVFPHRRCWTTEIMLQFDFVLSSFYRSSVEICCLSFTVQKLLNIFDLAEICPLGKFLTLVPATVFWQRIPATGVFTPQSSERDVTRERWEISTCGKKLLMGNRFLHRIFIPYLSRDTSGIQDGRQYGRRIMK